MSAERILIAMHDFAGGGTERIAVRLANEWSRRGRRVRIFCGHEFGPTRDMVSAQVQVCEAAPVLPRSLFSRGTLGVHLRQEALAWQPDVIFAPGNFHLPVLAAYNAAGGSRAKTVCKLSNPLDLRGFARMFAPLHALGLHKLTNDIDALVAMSPALRSEAVHVLRRPDILMAPEPILGGPLPAVAAMLPKHEASPLILCAGRLEKQKNFLLAIETFAALPPHLDAQLAILGEGSQRRILERQALRLGVADRLHMPGHVPNVAAWLQRATAFLSTSRYEGYPAVLVEAIAAGIPVITTDCSPAIGEIVEDAAQGDIVPHDPAMLAAALARRIEGRVATSSTDRSDRLQRHRVEWAAGAYLRLLDELAGSHPPAMKVAPLSAQPTGDAHAVEPSARRA